MAAINKGPFKSTWLQASRRTKNLPQTATEALFTVSGGRVLIKLLLGEVTTAIQAQANATKVSVNPTTGTTADITATLDINGDEAGTLYIVEGDGTALIGVNAGTGFGAAGLPHPWICPVGDIELVTAASNTGAIKWDCWYLPLDPAGQVNAAGV
jgi:hypothetical protein